ncbi:MAG: TolC family protein, partial [Cloacibacillus sp.]
MTGFYINGAIRRPRSLVCLLIFALQCVPAFADKAAETFAYAELPWLLELAAQKNATMSVVSERINQAKADLNKAYAEFSPELAVGGTARANDEIRYGRDKEETNALLNISQTLYAGGSLVANRLAAQMVLAAQIAEGSRGYQEVLHDVRRAYFDCLRSMAQLQVAKEALHLSEEHLRQAESLFKGGMASRGDVLRVKVSVNQSKLDIVTGQSNLEVAWTTLEHAVGTAVDKEKVLKAISQEEIDDLSPPHYAVAANTTELALTQRAEMRVYGFYSKRAKYLVRAARGQKAPRISLSGRLNSDEDANSLANGEWYVQLDLQWMIFDGGKIDAEINKAK